jgi:hypothetical protein
MSDKRISGKQHNFPYDIPKTFVITVGDRRPSSYQLEGSGENNGQPIPVDTARAIKVKRISNIMVYNKQKDMWEVKQTRYIRGCPTIWVDEQEKWKDANPAQSAIYIEDGNLSFGVDGQSVTKAMFLMIHENNSSFVGDEKYKRPDGAQDRFYMIDTMRDAEDIVEDFDYEVKVNNYLDRLKSKEKSGEVTYNKDLLEFLHSLFDLPQTDNGIGAETFVQLYARAKSDPKAFLKKIGDKSSLVESDMNKALAAKVIALDELGVVFVDGGSVFLRFTGKPSQKEMRLQLLEFLLNPSNRNVYDQLRAKTQESLIDESQVIQ